MENNLSVYRCIKCLNLSTRPNSNFKEGDVCEPCKYTASQQTDYDKLTEQFFKHISSITNFTDPKQLSFVLGVSGGKDSLRQAEFCRYALGINPTLVCVGYPPSMTSKLGVENLKNLYDKGYEIYTAYPATRSYKEIAKYCFFELGNLKVAMEIALFNGAAKLADLASADIILWGENPTFSVGDSGSKGSSYFDGSAIHKINTLSLVSNLPPDFVRKNKFFYNVQDGVKQISSKLVFLGGIMPKWSQVINGSFSIHRGFSPRKEELVDLLNISAVDEDFVLINQYIKYLKYGFGRTTDILNEFIRDGIIGRNEAIELAKKYDSYEPKKEISRFASFIGVEEQAVWDELFKNVNQEIFEIKNKYVYPKSILRDAT